MKVVVAALPAYGHVYPLVPLALALEEAGAEVAFATGDRFEGRLPLRTIRGATDSWDMADGLTETRRRAAGAHLHDDGRDDAWEFGRTLFVDVCATEVIDVLRQQLERERPDVVVFEQANIGAAIAARLVGSGAVSVSIVGWGGRWSHYYESAAARLGEQASASDLADLFVETHPDFMREQEATPPFPTIEMRPTAWSEQGEAPTWLLATRRAPRVYLTLGTVFGSADLLRATALEIADLGCEVLVATGPDVAIEDLGDMPPFVHVERLVAQTEVLSLVDAVVHHGGTGTVIGSLANGLPQVIVPQGADQFWNADHLAAQGVCRVVRPADPRGSVAAAVSELILPDAPERVEARRVGGIVAAMPSPAHVAGELLRRFAPGRVKGRGKGHG